MNEYKVEYSYIGDNGKRVYEYYICIEWTASEAADSIRSDYSALPGLRVEQVWVDTGRGWEVREFDC